MHGHGVQHCAWSWSTTQCMIMEYNTVHALGVQHCACFWSATLCMFLEYNTVHGYGTVLYSKNMHSVALQKHAQCCTP